MEGLCGFSHMLFPSLQSMRPNIFLGVSEGSAQYKKWYYELMVDHTEPFVTAEATHLRVGWASTEGYSPYPGGGEEWGGNGVGDDLFSYGFDGLHLWSGEYRPIFLHSILEGNFLPLLYISITYLCGSCQIH